MKTFILKAYLLWFFLSHWTGADAQRRIPISLAKHLTNWHAQAATETPNGFAIVGEQSISERRSKMVVTYTDSGGHARWTRTYPQLKGHVEAFSVAGTNSNRLWVAGRQNKQAKIWLIDPLRNGRLLRTFSLDTGCVRSIKTTRDGHLVVGIEQGHFIKVIQLSTNGKINWQRRWDYSGKTKSQILVTREGLIVLAYAGHGVALDQNGQTIWSHHNEATVWRGLYQRANGEVLFIGQQKTQLFGPINDEAYVMSVRPLQNKYEWFKEYGQDDTFDAAYQVAERPNGQLVVLTRQNRRSRLLELNQNLSIGKINWLTDSQQQPQPVAMLAQSAWQDKWLVVCNDLDGGVWLYPSRTNETSEVSTPAITFEILAKNAQGVPTLLTPISEVPPTFQLPVDSGAYSLHFVNCRSDDYAYLLRHTKETDELKEIGWVQLGSSDSLHLQISPHEAYWVLITKRPFAAPLQLLLKSEAYGSDQLQPENPKTSLHEQYPTTFNEWVEVNISANGSRFDINNLEEDGWIPLLFKTSQKNNRL
jgi:WD40 repeat protein